MGPVASISGADEPARRADRRAPVLIVDRGTPVTRLRSVSAVPDLERDSRAWSGPAASGMGAQPCGGPALDGPCESAHRGRVPVRRADQGLGLPCWPSVPDTPCPHPHAGASEGRTGRGMRGLSAHLAPTASPVAPGQRECAPTTGVPVRPPGGEPARVLAAPPRAVLLGCAGGWAKAALPVRTPATSPRTAVNAARPSPPVFACTRSVHPRGPSACPRARRACSRPRRARLRALRGGPPRSPAGPCICLSSIPAARSALAWRARRRPGCSLVAHDSAARPGPCFVAVYPRGAPPGASIRLPPRPRVDTPCTAPCGCLLTFFRGML